MGIAATGLFKRGHLREIEGHFKMPTTEPGTEARERPAVEPLRFGIATASVDDRGESGEIGRARYGAGECSAPAAPNLQSAARPPLRDRVALARELQPSDVVAESRKDGLISWIPCVQLPEGAAVIPVAPRQATGVLRHHAQSIQAARLRGRAQPMALGQRKAADKERASALEVRQEDVNVAGLRTGLVAQRRNVSLGRPRPEDRHGPLDALAGLSVPAPIQKQPGTLDQCGRDLETPRARRGQKNVMGLAVRTQGGNGQAPLTESA